MFCTVYNNESNIIIADNHPFFKVGLEFYLSQYQEFKISSIANNGQELVADCLRIKPDLVLSSFDLPIVSGIEAMRHIKDRIDGIKFIFFSNTLSSKEVLNLYKFGADGFFKITTDPSIIINIIRKTINSTYSFAINRSRNNLFLFQSSFLPIQTFSNLFSEREISIILLICVGKMSKEIAYQLDISLKTVEYYRSKIMDKMGVASVAEMVTYAIKNCLFDPFED